MMGGMSLHRGTGVMRMLIDRRRELMVCRLCGRIHGMPAMVLDAIQHGCRDNREDNQKCGWCSKHRCALSTNHWRILII